MILQTEIGTYNKRMGVQKRIYLDHAAATPLDPRVHALMEPYWSEKYGNAGAVHAEGREAEAVLEASRKTVADVLHARPHEIIFTSGGTESNALALFGTVKHYELAHGGSVHGLHIVTTAIEHPSILEGFRELKNRGATVDIIGVDARGIVDMDALQRAIQPHTFLVSVMYANNEIGTIQPIARIGKLIQSARAKGASEKKVLPGELAPPYFHTDASQAPLYLPLAVDAFGVDFLTVDAHKIYGPKGSGALYIRTGVPMHPLFRGGKQERGLRPGTPVIPLVAGLAEAMRFAAEERSEEYARMTDLRDYFIQKVLAEIPIAVLNGDRSERLPNNVNISLPGFESEYVLIALDSAGIAASARSACIDRGAGSYVVAALARDADQVKSALRFSLGKTTTREDIDRTVAALAKITATAHNDRVMSSSSATS